MQEILQAKRIITVVRKGSSMPVVVEANDGKHYHLKLQGSLSSPVATLCDWLACTIGRAIGLPIIRPVAIAIDTATDNSAIDSEMKDLVAKSRGLNIAFPFYANAADFHPNDTARYPELLSRLFAFDIFLLNIDRQTTNTNILITDNHVCAFDYESSFLLMAIVNNTTPSYNNHILQQLRNNPLYNQDTALAAVQRELRALQAVSIHELLRSVPEEWIASLTTTPREYLRTVAQRIQEMAHDEELYTTLVERIHALTKETDEERKQKALANREKFKQQYLQ